MARLNIEDDFWIDVLEVGAKMANANEAIGISLKFLKAAQALYARGKFMPESEFTDRYHEALIGVFAERTPSGIQAKGSEKHFGWLKGRIEAGKKGGLSKTEAKRSKLKQNVANRSKTEASYSYSIKTENSNRSAKGEVLSEPTYRVQEFIGVYIRSFQSRFPKSRPDLGGKVQGQIKGFLKEQNNFHRSCELIQAFFQIEEKWFETKGYDFSTFTSNVQRIGIALDSGCDTKNELQAWYLKNKDKEGTKEISA